MSFIRFPVSPRCTSRRCDSCSPARELRAQPGAGGGTEPRAPAEVTAPCGAAVWCGQAAPGVAKSRGMSFGLGSARRSAEEWRAECRPHAERFGSVLPADVPLGRPRPEVPLQRLDYQPVILSLGQSGHGDGPDDWAVTAQAQRKRPSVRRVAVRGEPRRLLEGRALHPKALSHQVGARRVTLDDTPLAVDPGVVVRARAGQRGVEHLLDAAADVDGDRCLPLPGALDQERAETPGFGVAEAREDEPALLLLEGGQQLARTRRCHQPPPPSSRTVRPSRGEAAAVSRTAMRTPGYASDASA